MVNNNNNGDHSNNNLNNTVYQICDAFTPLGFKKSSVACPKSHGSGGEPEFESGRPQSLCFGNCVK